MKLNIHEASFHTPIAPTALDFSFLRYCPPTLPLSLMEPRTPYSKNSVCK